MSEERYTERVQIMLTPTLMNALEREADKKWIRASALARLFVIDALQERDAIPAGPDNGHDQS